MQHYQHCESKNALLYFEMMFLIPLLLSDVVSLLIVCYAKPSFPMADPSFRQILINLKLVGGNDYVFASVLVLILLKSLHFLDRVGPRPWMSIGSQICTVQR